MSPALQGKKQSKLPENRVEKTFVPTKMPDFGDAPLVRPTRKSMAHAQWNKEPRVSVAERNKMERRIVPYVVEKTVPRPFSLMGVDQHEIVVERREAESGKYAEEEKRRRTFRPVILREDILEGPTFVPSRSPVPLTTPVDLLPMAQERKERTTAYLARQRERMEEMERLQKKAREEKEQKESEQLQKLWQVKRFKPRPVPRSHYMPDIEPVGSGADSRLSEIQIVSAVPELSDGARGTETKAFPAVETEAKAADVTREGVFPTSEKDTCPASETEISPVAEEESEMTAPPATETEAKSKVSPDSQTLIRRSSILDGIRKSLSPLFGSPESPATQVADAVSKEK